MRTQMESTIDQKRSQGARLLTATATVPVRSVTQDPGVRRIHFNALKKIVVLCKDQMKPTNKRLERTAKRTMYRYIVTTGV
jgi:hypothetical protein